MSAKRGRPKKHNDEDLYVGFIHQPPVPNPPRSVRKKKLSEITDIKEIQNLLENPEEETVIKENKRVCPECHHYKESPRKGLSHRCPLNSDGSKKKCQGWSLCPTAYRKGHPEVDPQPQTKKRILFRLDELKKQVAQVHENKGDIPVDPTFLQALQEIENKNLARADPTLQKEVIETMRKFVISKQRNLLPEGADAIIELQRITPKEKFRKNEEEKENNPGKIVASNPKNLIDLTTATDEVSFFLTYFFSYFFHQHLLLGA